MTMSVLRDASLWTQRGYTSGYFITSPTTSICDERVECDGTTQTFQVHASRLTLPVNARRLLMERAQS